MLKIKTELEKLKTDGVYNDWIKEHSGAYLSYVMNISSNGKLEGWSVGFYSGVSDKITTFIVNDNVEIMGEDEVFKKDETKVNELKLEDVKVGIDDAIKISKSFQEKEYSGQLPMKIICILQNLDDLGVVWNMTYITLTFATLNIKIGALNGDVKKHTLTSLNDYKQS